MSLTVSFCLLVQSPEGFLAGEIGGRAASHVGGASKKESDCATILPRPMAGHHARDKARIPGAATPNFVQVAFTSTIMFRFLRLNQ